MLTLCPPASATVQRETARSWSLDGQAASHPLQLHSGALRVQGRYVCISQTDLHSCQYLTGHSGWVWGPECSPHPSFAGHLSLLEPSPTEAQRSPSGHSDLTSASISRPPTGLRGQRRTVVIVPSPEGTRTRHWPIQGSQSQPAAALGYHPASHTPGLQPGPDAGPMGDRLHRQT